MSYFRKGGREMGGERRRDKRWEGDVIYIYKQHPLKSIASLL
jgi:hypothetical protein